MKFTSSSLKQRESARKYAHRRQSSELVRRRATVGGRFRCEGCDHLVDVIEVGHVFGKGSRRAGIPEVWASTPELCAALCCAASWGDRIGCHEKHDRSLDERLSMLLEVDAEMRLASLLKLDKRNAQHTGWSDFIEAAEGDSLDTVRNMIRYAEANGIEPT